MKTRKLAANGKLAVSVNRDIGTITFDFSRPGMSARTLAATPPITFHVARVNSAHHETAEYHGWIQRLRDTAAGKALDAGYAAVRKLVDHYESGTAEWNTTPARGPSLADMLVAALVELKGKSEETIRAYVDAKSAGAQRKIASLPDVAAKIAEMFGTDEEIDLDSELDELDAALSGDDLGTEGDETQE